MDLDTLLVWGLPSLGLVVVLVLAALVTKRLVKRTTPGASPRVIRIWTRLVLFGVLLMCSWIWASLVPLPPAAHEVVVNDLQPWFWGTVALFAIVAVGIALLRRFLDLLGRAAKKSEIGFDDVVIGSVRRPAHVLLLLAAFAFWVDLVPAPDALTNRVGLIAQAAVIIIGILFADALVIQIIERRKSTSRVLATTGNVFQTMSRALLYVVGTLMVLATFGIEIMPIVASLGVGSLAIGLALQGTLEDFIGGLLIAADQPISVGDFVEVGGFQGTVQSIGWRTTRIYTLERTNVIVPNSVLAKATIINRSRPSPIVRFTTTFIVDEHADLARVASTIQVIANDLQQTHPAATRDYVPEVVFASINERGVELKVWLEAVDWVPHEALLDALIRKVHATFEAEGLELATSASRLELSPALESHLEGLVNAKEP